MGTAQKYRRFGEECVQLARTTKNLQTQAVLLHMAEVWFRLADQHAAEAAEKIEAHDLRSARTSGTNNPGGMRS